MHNCEDLQQYSYSYYTDIFTLMHGMKHTQFSKPLKTPVLINKQLSGSCDISCM
jgi:hypothetical protein